MNDDTKFIHYKDLKHDFAPSTKCSKWENEKLRLEDEIKTIDDERRSLKIRKAEINEKLSKVNDSIDNENGDGKKRQFVVNLNELIKNNLEVIRNSDREYGKYLPELICLENFLQERMVKYHYDRKIQTEMFDKLEKDKSISGAKYSDIMKYDRELKDFIEHHTKPIILAEIKKEMAHIKFLMSELNGMMSNSKYYPSIYLASPPDGINRIHGRLGEMAGEIYKECRPDYNKVLMERYNIKDWYEYLDYAKQVSGLELYFYPGKLLLYADKFRGQGMEAPPL